MKKIVCLFLASWMGAFLYAQNGDDAQPQNGNAREKIKAARIGLITQRLALSPEQAERFWPIYNEYTRKRTDLRVQYKEAEKNINPNNPDPKQQAALIDLGLKLKQDELTLDKEYSNKLMGVISAQQLLNLRQAEKDFRNILINMLNNRRLQQQRKETVRDMKLREHKK